MQAHIPEKILPYSLLEEDTRPTPSFRQQTVQIRNLLKICNDQGFYQKCIFTILLVLNIIQGQFVYSIFYIFYFPKYICESEHGSFECAQAQACRAGQKYSFERGGLWLEILSVNYVFDFSCERSIIGNYALWFIMSTGLFVFLVSFFMDKLGRKWTFFVCFGMFGVGSLFVLFSQNVHVFILGMVVLKLCKP